MKIAVMQASSQKEKNSLLYQCTKQAAEPRGHEVVNFGVFPEEEASYSYVETALLIGLLLSSRAVDFVVTGCSSGQGMMLACNSLPGVLCGYAPTPQDAFLFGRINGGNAVSLPLGLNFGWMGEINLQCTLDKLLDGGFGIGWPPWEAERKQGDARLLKELNQAVKGELAQCFPRFPREPVDRALTRNRVIDYIKAYGSGPALSLLGGTQLGKER